MAEQRVNILVYRPDGTLIAQYLLGEGEHLIGREYGCPIYLESDYISSQHAKLQLAADGIHIEDLNSTSGTFLDGVTVRGKLRIKPGQVLQVGDLTIDLQPESEDQIGPGSRLGGGRYTLVKLLGRGGMGEVWLAQDGQLDEQVALKRLPSEMGNDPVAIADLKREVQKSRLLSHRNIIRIHDLYQQPGEDALVSLEYVDGTDLAALANTKTDRIFPWEEIKLLIVQLCEALDHAHEEKIVHRDLKPANMMLTREGKLKLADFGIAATMADSLSRSSMRDVISGTSLYMSPQQMEGEVPRASDDIYAFGATLYELLTSRQPFYTGDIQHQVLNVIPKPMDQRLVEFGLSNPVPDYVNQLVMSCLAKDVEGRPASAAGIRDWINSEGKVKGVLGKTSTKTMQQARPQSAEVAVASLEAEEGQRKSKAPLIATIVVVAILAVGLGIWFSGGDKENTGDKKGKASPISTEMQTKLKQGLVAYYPFNGNAKDESGNGNDGKVKGATLTNDRHGKSNSAYEFVEFDGKGGRIVLPPFKYGKQFTVSIWANSYKHPASGVFFAKKPASDIDSIDFSTGNGKYEARVYSDNDTHISRSAPNPGLGTQKWSHLVFSYDGGKSHSSIGIYKNGVQIDDADIPSENEKSTFTTFNDLDENSEIGSHNSGTATFNGKMDDVRIYNRALSEEEVKALYDLEKSISKVGDASAKKPGTLLWESKSPVWLSPALGHDGTVYVAPIDRRIAALNGKTGVEKWVFRTEKWIQSCPAIGIDGTVYIGANENTVYALDGKTGAKKLTFKSEAPMHGTPAIGSNGTIYMGSRDGKIYAFQSKTGNKLWEFQTGGDVYTSPAIGTDGTVYVESHDKKIYALNGATGIKKWEFETGSDRGRSSPAIGTDGTVYVGATQNKKVYAMDGKTGAKKWEFETGDNVRSSPVIGSDGTVYVGSDDKKVYALSGKTGAKKWEFETGGEVVSSAAIGDDGTVYIGSNDKKVYALDGKSGTKNWEFQTGDVVHTAPIIGPDGILYIGSNDGNTYAFATSSKGPAKSPWPMYGQNAQHTCRAGK